MRSCAACVIAVVVAIAGCASVGEQQSDDLDAVRATVQARTAIELPAMVDDTGELAPEVRELLQAELTEDSAVKIAALNNRQVRAALARLNVSSAELVQAGLLKNPVFSANAKMFDEGTEVEIGVLQPFIDVFFVSARKRAAESELEATRADIAAEIVRLSYDVRRAFLGVRAAQRVLAVDRDALRAAQSSFDLMRELHRSGNVTDPRLTAEELALSSAKLDVARAESDLSDAREPLNVLLGLWGDGVEWTIAGASVEAPETPAVLEHVETRAIDASLDLAAGRAHALLEARRVGLTGWERAFSTGEIGITAKRESVDGEWGIGPAIAFGLPVFDGGGASRAIADAHLRAALYDHVSLAVEVRSAARRLCGRALALEQQAQFLRSDVLPAAQRLVQETLRNYNAMQIGAFDVLAVKQQEIAARREEIESSRDAALARLDLEELLAGHLNRARVAAQPTRSVGASARRTGDH